MNVCCPGVSLTDTETKEDKPQGSPQRQTSVDSSLSGLTDSGYTGDVSGASEMASRTGFRPLSEYGHTGLQISSKIDRFQNAYFLISQPNPMMLPLIGIVSEKLRN